MPEDVGRLIIDAVKKRTNEIIDDEAGKMAERVQERVKAEADKIALSVLSYYDITINGQKIIISVDKSPGVR